MTLKQMSFPCIFCILLCYALGLLSIGLISDWHLIHEDNGAVHTTLALTHLRLGLVKTRAHDLFFNPGTGETALYGHHPPLTALLLAGMFWLTGSDAPHVARMVPILFHLGSLSLLVLMLSRLLSKRLALLGGFFMATLPMSAYFGRMVNYEPLCLFAISIQLIGYVIYRQHRSIKGLVWLCIGVFLGGLIDWGSFFFTAVILGVEVFQALRERPRVFFPAFTIALVAGTIFLLDLLHLWYAGHGSLTALHDVLCRNNDNSQKIKLIQFFFGQIDVFRRYYTHAGLISSFFALFCLTFPHKPVSRRFFHMPEAPMIKHLLLITGMAAAGYVCSAPSWARMHLYWQFYFLPFVSISLVLTWSFVWERVVDSPSRLFRILATVLMLEVLITSTYMLHFRHTRTGGYAVRQTAILRETYLAPAHLTD